MHKSLEVKEYLAKANAHTCSAIKARKGRPGKECVFPPYRLLFRRIHQGYFRELFPNGISALGYFWGWGKLKFSLRVKSLPGDNPNPPSGAILDPTVVCC